MQAHIIKWFGPSTLAAAAIFASSGSSYAADALAAPTYTAIPCCQLCPEAQQAKNYVTSYQQNFVTLMQAQGEWLFRSQEDLRTEFASTPEGYAHMKALRDAFKAKGVELVVVYQPTRGLVNREKLTPAQKAAFKYDLALKNYKAELGRLAATGLNVPDLTPLADEKLPADQAEQDFYFRGDQHWTPYGSQRTAHLVADYVHQMKAFEGIPRKEFESHRIGRMGKKGTLHNVAGAMCNTSYAIQYMDQFTTEPKSASSGDDLFADATTPDITLVGTSHSDKNYNFGGFLQEYIGADILNVAFPGGGLEGSMVQYLSSDEFQKHPPKILIWEFSPLYKLDQDSVYRQMMALLDDGCTGKTALLHSTVQLKPGVQTDVLINGTGPIQDIRNGDYRIDLQYQDKSVKIIHAMMWYMNGRHEQLKLDKPKTVDTNGRFAFEMRTDKDWADQRLLALELQGPERDDAETVLPQTYIPGTLFKPSVSTGSTVPVAVAPQKVEATICKRTISPRTKQATAQTGL